MPRKELQPSDTNVDLLNQNDTSPKFSERFNLSSKPSLYQKWRQLRLPLRILSVILVTLTIFLVTFALGYFGSYLFKDGGRSSLLSGYPDSRSIKSVFPVSSTTGDEVASPINGLLYSQEDAAVWQGRRPLAIMINNHLVSRQAQAGLSSADLVYEAVAEGGISRFLGIFHANLPEKVGTVRSARVYYIDWAREFNAWYAHHGRAQIDPNNPAVCFPEADAFARMQQVFVSSIEGTSSCWREPNGLDYEHTLFCSPAELLEEGYKLYPDQSRSVEISPWLFKQDQAVAAASAISTVSFNFWNTISGYNVQWRYQSASNTYLRWQNDQPHLDQGNKQQLEAKTIIVQYANETLLKDLKAHLLYQTLGQGKAEIFMDGRVIKATWERPTIEQRTKYYDSNNKEVEFNRGQIWVEVVPLDTQILYT